MTQHELEIELMVAQETIREAEELSLNSGRIITSSENIRIGLKAS